MSIEIQYCIYILVVTGGYWLGYWVGATNTRAKYRAASERRNNNQQEKECEG